MSAISILTDLVKSLNDKVNAFEARLTKLESMPHNQGMTASEESKPSQSDCSLKKTKSDGPPQPELKTWECSCYDETWECVVIGSHCPEICRYMGDRPCNWKLKRTYKEEK